jgi:hypothetical protein
MVFVPTSSPKTRPLAVMNAPSYADPRRSIPPCLDGPVWVLVERILP